MVIAPSPKRSLSALRIAGTGLIAVASIGKALWDSTSRVEVVDLAILSQAGRTLFTARWTDVFSDVGIQVGPLTLAAQGGLAEIARALSIDLQVAFAVVVQPAVILSCLWMVGRGIHLPERRMAVQAMIAILLLMWEVPWNAYVFGHPTEFFIPLLWLGAAWAARGMRPGIAGLLIAISGGLKLWGVLGLPILLLERRLRPSLRGVATALIALGLMYGPFFLLGDIATFDYEWLVAPGTGAALVLDEGSTFGWAPRVVQGAAAAAIGVGVALIARSRPEVFLWTPALAIIGARLATDPVAQTYFWLGAQAVLFVAAGWFVGTGALIPAVLVVGLCAMTFVAAEISVVGVSLLLMLVAVAAATFGDRVDLTWVPLRRTVRAG